MENNIVSHIKFTVKDGCVDAFVEAMNKIDKDPLLQLCARSPFSQMNMYLSSPIFMMT